MTAEAQYDEFPVMWSDLDTNGHVRHTVYGNWGGEARHRALARVGVSPGRLVELGIGPVLVREEARYLREVRRMDRVRVVTKLGGLSPDGSRWRIRHEIHRADGELAARIKVEGTWIDLSTRRPAVPPDEVRAMYEPMERSKDFEELKSLVRA